jgi:hypothetical protein
VINHVVDEKATDVLGEDIVGKGLAGRCDSVSSRAKELSET